MNAKLIKKLNADAKRRKHGVSRVKTFSKSVTNLRELKED